VNVNASQLHPLGVFQIAALALFLLVFVGRAVQLRIRGHINPIALSLGKRGLLGVAELALFLAVNLWAIAVIGHALPGFDLPLPAWCQVELIRSSALRVVGVGLTTLAFLICLLALRALGDSWRLGIDERQPGRLVTNGIYSFSRNPIFVFFDLYFISTFLLNGTLLFLLFALFTIANLHYQILEEERFLVQTHGSAYELYRRRTCRYATWQWVADWLSWPDLRKHDRRSVRRPEDRVTGPSP
jgi:protein-S-isoprenylcysteine O-methyltransferase Ste14